MTKRNYGNSIVSNMSVVLNSVFVLYFILILALSNLFYLVSSANYMFASIFILTGFLTSFFSKNMIVILCIALTITNILQFGKNASHKSEGFAEDEDDEDYEDDEDPTSKKNKLSEGFAGDEEEDEEDEDTPSTTKVSNKSTEQFNSISSDYNELLGLQYKITDNMSTLNHSLTKSENILKNLAKTINVDINM